MSQGHFVTEWQWAPAEFQVGSSPEYPHLIVAPHRMWSQVRHEVQLENPEYAVKLVSPGAALYGERISSYEFRYCGHLMEGPVESRLAFEEWWSDMLDTRVAPS